MSSFKWIPVEKDSPAYEGEYLVTLENTSGNRVTGYLRYDPLHISGDHWEVYDIDYIVTAWTKIEPYVESNLISELKEEALSSTDLIEFVRTFNEVQNLAHEISRLNGFWNTAEHIMSEAGSHDVFEKFKALVLLSKIMLVVAELSECCETIRKEIDRPDDHIPDFNNVEVEFADAIIRMMDIASWRLTDWNISGALVAKLTYNVTRPYMHGKQA